MCHAPSSPIIGTVDGKTVIIRLELQLAGDSLTGRASDGTGAARDFAGWLGLVAALDALVAGTAAGPGAPGGDDFTSSVPRGKP
jgi:hypothetical protein